MTRRILFLAIVTTILTAMLVARADARRKQHDFRHAIPHFKQWLCIHHYEGAWNAHTGNGYYGGLQMDYGFMRRYGGWILKHHGTADRWKPRTQMLVAERAYRSGRGFHPWPNTARMCGLL